MTRGDFITVSLSGDYGKPRPALVIQSNAYGHLDSITVLPLTSEMLTVPNTRVTIKPNVENGLRETSYIMTDKIGTHRRMKAGPVIGKIDDATLRAVENALATFLGFA